MALFKVTIQKSIGNEFWTNGYTVDVSSLQAAADVGDELVQMERSFHGTNVLFDKMRASTMVVGDYQFITHNTGFNGLLSINGNALPLFNVLLVMWNTPSGRPNRSYYRVGWGGEDTQNPFSWSSSKITSASAGMASIAGQLIADAYLVDNAGQTLVSYTLQHVIAMRQLRRGSKRNEPVLP